MAFIYTDLYPNTASNGSYCGSWNYTTLDTVATASAVGYFNAVATRISIGDVIFVSVVDAVGGTRTTLVDQAQLYVSSIVAGVVTTTSASSGGGGTPDDPDTSVQFNDGGAFGGQADFTFVKGSGLVSLPALEVSTGAVSTPAGATATDAGITLSVYAGDGGATSGAGGGIQLQAGFANGSGAGGAASLAAGYASVTGDGGRAAVFAGNADDDGAGGDALLYAGGGGGTTGNGGNVAIRSGDASGTGDSGTIDIIAGTASGGGDGGPVVFTGGTAQLGDGGSVTLDGGVSNGGNGNGGDVNLNPGHKNGSGIAGHVKIDTLENFATDALALAGGVPVTGLYRTGNEVRVNAAATNAAHSIEVVLDGGGAVLTTGIKGYLEVPFALTITQATLLAAQSGSVVVDIFKCTYAQFDASSTHPVAGDKITASAPPTITTATKSQDATLTGWTTAVAAGSILGFNINSATTITRVTLSLTYTR